MTPRQWFSRRAGAGVLASGSVIAWQGLLDFLITAVSSELVDLVVVTLLFYQSSLGSPVAGQLLSVVLFGYLVAAYTPELYGGRFPTVTRNLGFRALTGGLTVYFGTVMIVFFGFLPPTVLFGILSKGTTGDALAVAIGGLLIGTLAFVIYFQLGDDRALGGPGTTGFAIFAAFTPKTSDDPVGEFEKHLEAAPRLWRAAFVITSPMILTGLCLLLGVVLLLFTLYYPLPEVLVLGAVVISYVNSRLGQNIGVSGGALDIEVGTVLDIGATFQNSKGLFLAFYCLMGAVFSPILSIVMIGVLHTEADRIVAVFFWMVHALTIGNLIKAGEAAVVLWALGGFILLFLIYGWYGLFYWLRQLKRLPPYISFWEQWWRGEAHAPPSVSIARPPWLFIPGDLIIVTIGVLLLLVDRGAPRSVLIAIISLIWPALVLLVAWSVKQAVHGPPQPLNGEGRDVLMAFILQLVSVSLWMELIGLSVLELVLTLPVLVLLYYYPDVFHYASRQSGLVYLRTLYTTILMGIGLPILLVFLPVSHPVVGLLGVVLGILIVIQGFVDYIERRVET